MYPRIPPRFASAIDAGTLLAGRYRVGTRSGAGCFGTVYAGTDEVLGRPVAIKFFHPGLPREHRRQEALALRGLRLGQVATLLDEGLHDGAHFIVMPWVDGAAFPGELPPDGTDGFDWPGLVERALGLCRRLAQIHAAGAAHLDVRADNVLVDQAGAVHLVDLGLADVSAYAQLSETGAADDVLQAGRLIVRSIRVGSEIPAAVGRTLSAMQAYDPAERPTAWQAYLGLGGDDIDRPPVPRGGGPLDAAAVLKLVGGSERLYPHRRRTVSHLLGITGGEPDHLDAMFQSAIQRGVATVRDGRYVFDLSELAATSPRVASIAELMDAYGNGLDDRCFGLARAWLQQLTSHREVAQVLRLLGLSALSTRRVDAVLEARYWCQRLEQFADPALDVVLQAAELAVTQPARALGVIEAAPAPTHDDELLVWWGAFQWRFVRGAERPARLRQAAGVLRHRGPVLEAKLNDWRGLEAYLGEDYEEASRLHLFAAQVSPSPRQQLPATLNACRALLELGAYDEIRVRAEQAYRLAVAVGHMPYAAQATWVQRDVAWRAGQASDPDPELIEAFEMVGDLHLAGLAALCEAAGVWRQGRLDEARPLARQAERALAQLADSRGALPMATAIRLCCTPGATFDAVAADALSLRWPTVAWQILGIVVHAPSGRAWLAEAKALAAAAPDPHRRREVLAPIDVLELPN